MSAAFKPLRALLLFFALFSSPISNSLLASEKVENVTLYYSPYCPYCMKVINYLHQIRKTLPMKDVSKDASAKEELIKYGGKAQVPCLFIDNKPLYESDKIVEWIKTHQAELPDES